MLVVDRDDAETRALTAFLRARDLEVAWTRDGASAHNVIEERSVDALVTALESPRIDGMALLERARERHSEICAVMIAEPPELERAVDALRRGAWDFQRRPVHAEKLVAVLERGFAHQELAARLRQAEGRLDERMGFERLSGHSRAIQRVMEQVRATAATRAPVLIEGETGTGKGLVAQAIHQNSPRKGERFVWASCAALDEGLVESELFGAEPEHTGGAARPGRFEMADAGTLFLDDVGEIPSSVQVKLLRVLQDRAFERVGGTETIKVDVRLLAATNRDLAAEVEAGRFREDLFYRLSVVRVSMPPLRERREDIPLLIESFLRDFARQRGRRAPAITRGALDRLTAYAWPGNVRELKSVIAGMVALADVRRPLELSDLPPALREVAAPAPALAVAVGMTVEEAERQLIAATLEHTRGDKRRAAAMLGIGLRTLYRKLEQYSLR